MTPEQEAFWTALKCDAKWFAHVAVLDLQNLTGDTFHNAVDQLLAQMYNYLSAEDISNVIKTWLSTYNLPLDARKLGPGFDLVHQKVGSYIMSDTKRIRVVEVI